MSEHHSPVDPSDATIAPDAGTAPSLTDIARDPVLIAGIYDGCDQWCVYCRATGRCLAFRATNAVDVGGVFDPAGADDGQGPGGSLLLKVLADVEGRLAPPEIEAVASGDPRLVQQVFGLDDPLERLGRRYMMLAGAYLGSLERCCGGAKDGRQAATRRATAARRAAHRSTRARRKRKSPRLCRISGFPSLWVYRAN